MVSQVSFGRRGMPQRPQRQGGAPAAPPPAAPPDARPRAAPTWTEPSAELRAVDGEVAAWKAARTRQRRLPWRQLSLIASLCFGIAAFVLPHAVNAAVQWPLYGLMAASFYTGMRRRLQG